MKFVMTQFMLEHTLKSKFSSIPSFAAIMHSLSESVPPQLITSVWN